MGIRFYCPGCGHKLNVKAFQAGLQGLCPYCGASIPIPTKSTRPSSKQLRQGRASPKTPDAPGRTEPAERPLAGPATQSPSPSPVEPAGQTPVQPAPQTPPVTPAPGPIVPQGPPVSFPSPLGSPASSAPEQASRSPREWCDPLFEAPDAVWYVQPPNGPQYGPATRDTMQTWLTEGRVRADCLVWREGWQDWQEAADVFPQLSAQSSPEEGNPEFGVISPRGPALAKTAARRYPQQSRRRSTVLNAAIVAVLILAVIVLVWVFIWVLSGGPEGLGNASHRASASLVWAAAGRPAGRSSSGCTGHH